MFDYDFGHFGSDRAHRAKYRSRGGYRHSDGFHYEDTEHEEFDGNHWVRRNHNHHDD